LPEAGPFETDFSNCSTWWLRNAAPKAFDIAILFAVAICPWIREFNGEIGNMGARIAFRSAMIAEVIGRKVEI
jgi:hypothetical protein